MMVARVCAIAGFIAAACTAVAAEDLGGRYEVKGALANGKNYVSGAEIVMTSDTTCEIAFSDGPKGVCILDGTTLSVAVVVSGVAQVGVYKVAPDGSMEGVFIDNFHGAGLNKEKLTPVH